MLVNYPQSLARMDDDTYQASLIEEGINVLKTSKHKHPRLEAGIHYRVKDDAGIDFIPFPDGLTCDSFRHNWIIKKRHRPVAPVLVGSPVPMKRADSGERSAMLTMAYFHPWTLQTDGTDNNIVPYAGMLRKQGESWQAALSYLLNGNAVSHESVRYITNLMSVYRVRPKDVDEDILSDEDFQDEELELTGTDLAEALETRIGCHASKKKQKE